MSARPTRTIKHPIHYREDVQAEILALTRGMDTGRGRLSDPVSVAEKIEAVYDRHPEDYVSVTFQALPHQQYRDLLAEHSARDGDTVDARVGYNLATLPGPLVKAAAVAVTAHDGTDLTHKWDGMVDDTHPGEMDRLFTAAMSLQQYANPQLP